MKSVCVCLNLHVHIFALVAAFHNRLTLAPPLLGLQAFIVREAEAMIGEPDPNRVMVWFTNRRTKYKKHHGVLPVRDTPSFPPKSLLPLCLAVLLFCARVRCRCCFCCCFFCAAWAHLLLLLLLLCNLRFSPLAQTPPLLLLTPPGIAGETRGRSPRNRREAPARPRQPEAAAVGCGVG